MTETWAVPTGGSTLWDYDSGSEQLLALYAKGKQRQWDAETRLGWDHEVDPEDPLGMPACRGLPRDGQLTDDTERVGFAGHVTE